MIFLLSYAVSNQQSQDFQNYSFIHVLMLRPLQNPSLEIFKFLLSPSIQTKLFHFSPISHFIAIYPCRFPFDDCDYAATGSTASADIIFSLFISELE